uniref:Large ribosomal subunit protein bL28c n=1 Tax=Sciadococcus taiwanensis TaxID=3028030 RepID=A0A9Y1I240_9RHOD|nr:ribosomal protein L28 [Sciadococcus taiwanensis]
MSKKCKITGTVANNGYKVTYSHKRNKKLQNVNLQIRKIWIKSQKRYLKVKLSTKAIKLLRKNNLEQVLKNFNTSL